MRQECATVTQHAQSGSLWNVVISIHQRTGRIVVHWLLRWTRGQVINRHNWFGAQEIHTWRRWHKMGAVCRPQSVSYSCGVFKLHCCSSTSGITLSKYACLNKSGTSKKRWYIPIDAVSYKLPRGSEASLLAFHALSGCDTTSYITNHTKWSSGNTFKEHHSSLKNLGIGEITE